MNGEQIKQIRLANFLSQEQFAVLLKTANNTVCRWEKGQVPISLRKAKLLNELIISGKLKGV